jgi:dynein heavy chain, axonemal
MHQSVEKLSLQFAAEQRRMNYVTPTSYLELLGTFKRLLDEKRGEIEATRIRLETGLQKLLSTADQVADMQRELHELQPVLHKTAAEVETMMQQIDVDNAAVADTKAVVEAQEAIANEKAASAKAIADDAQADLEKALPALDEAVSSLKSLSKNDIVEVKSLSNPPAGVKMVMDATCIMFDMKGKKVADPNGAPGAPKLTDYWDDAKRILNDPGKFLNSLMTYDKENIPSVRA